MTRPRSTLVSLAVAQTRDTHTDQTRDGSDPGHPHVCQTQTRDTHRSDNSPLEGTAPPH